MDQEGLSQPIPKALVLKDPPDLDFINISSLYTKNELPKHESVKYNKCSTDASNQL